jgi:hypothetical protein
MGPQSQDQKEIHEAEARRTKEQKDRGDRKKQPKRKK